VPLPERHWRRVVVAGIPVAIGISLLTFPYLLDGALARFGVRRVCSALLALGAVSFGLGGRARSSLGVVAWPGLAMAGVLALGLASGERSALRLVPAFVYAGLAATFHASLAREDSIIERAARFIVPETPDFVRPYCRKLTAFWVAFFAAMLVVSALEFFVRKTWFRYYFHGGAFDRFWARLFPAENTEQGRRSAAYIQRYREKAAGDARARG
jgi:uncharacterized membrane protein